MGLKDYKIVWFTEGGWQGKVGLDNPNMRNDVSTMYTVGAEHYPIFQIPQVLQHFGENHFDFGIVTLPKTNTEELMKFDMMGDLKKLCKKTISMQEGPHWLFQDYTMEQQIWWYNALTEFDMLFAHNNKDVKYYKGLTNKPVHKMPTLMLAERLGIESNRGKNDSVIIGGNMVRWYGGFDSYIVAQEFGVPISAPSMGRKIDREDEMDINHFPYMTWVEWINNLGKFKYGVHLMPTHAAGTFTLNCAFHGIPCIGYKGLDTQEELHPLLSVDDGDMETAMKLARRLKDGQFYEECSIMCRENYESSLYIEERCTEYLSLIFEDLINE
ncbi:hypothetical protein HOE22_02780 [Candidatus Woesearchaeota archaeon]|nr:hypothetical protein [Candidatus Woesearchaeota archaeon]